MERLVWHTLSAPFLSHNDGRPLKVGTTYSDTRERGLHGAFRAIDAFHHIPKPKYICLVSISDLIYENKKRLAGSRRYVHDVRLVTPRDIVQLRALLLKTYQEYRRRLAIYEADLAETYRDVNVFPQGEKDTWLANAQRLARHLAYGQRQMVEHTEREWFLDLHTDPSIERKYQDAAHNALLIEQGVIVRE